MLLTIANNTGGVSVSSASTGTSSFVSGSAISSGTSRYLAVKRRVSQQSPVNDHEIEDVLNEWANMTGFLCALGSVALNIPPLPQGSSSLPSQIASSGYSCVCLVCFYHLVHSFFFFYMFACSVVLKCAAVFDLF